MAESKRILAIETSGRHGSVAALGGDVEPHQPMWANCPHCRPANGPGFAPALNSCWPRPIGRQRTSSWLQSPSVPARSRACGSASQPPKHLPTPSEPKSSASTRSAHWPPKRRLLTSPLVDILDAQRQELFAAKFAVGENLDVRAERDTPSFRKTLARRIATRRPRDRACLKRLASRLPAGVEVLPEQ